jgi:transposase
MARQERAAGTRVARKATAGVSVPEIATTLQVPESVVRTYLATQTFRGVRLTFTQRQGQKSRRAARQWRQRPLKGM